MSYHVQKATVVFYYDDKADNLCPGCAERLELDGLDEMEKAPSGADCTECLAIAGNRHLGIQTAKLDAFTLAYVECALWSSHEYNEEGETGAPLDANYSLQDLSDGLRLEIMQDCAAFQKDNAETLGEAYELYSHNPEWSHEAQAGHDFWLTRNGHGAGFWDRGLGEAGRKLTAAAKVYGSVDLQVFEGRIYA